MVLLLVAVQGRKTLIRVGAVRALDVAVFLIAEVDAPDMVLQILLVGRAKATLVAVKDLTCRPLVNHAGVEFQALRRDKRLAAVIAAVWPDTCVYAVVHCEALFVTCLVGTQVTQEGLGGLPKVD